MIQIKDTARRNRSLTVLLLLLGVLVTTLVLQFGWLGAASGAANPSPPVITAKPANPTNVQATSFSFTGTGSVTFECALDTPTFTACSSPKSYGALPAGSHTFKVRAKSGTKVSSPTSYAWLIDLSPPARPVVTSGPAPLPGWSTTAPSQFSFTGEAGASFLCSLDGGPNTPCSSGVSYAVSQQVTHTFAVRAKDAAGNVGLPSTPVYQWRVDTVAPAVPVITVKPPDPSSSATSTFDWTDSSPDVVAYQCSKENGAFVACGPPPITFAVETTNNGQHQFAVRAIDAAGNISGAASYMWKVDKGSLQNFTISGDAQGTLAPGAAPQPINLAFSNPNSMALVVTSLTVTKLSVSAPNSTLSLPCTLADYAVAQFSGAYDFTIPAGASTLQSVGVAQPGWPTVQLINRDANQDGCKGATITLSYTGSAHS